MLFVCVYDQDYALVIVMQPEKEESEILLDSKTQFLFIIQAYKTGFVWF